MLRPRTRLAIRLLNRRAAMVCDSRWFRLAVVVMLVSLLLPSASALAGELKHHRPQPEQTLI